METTETWRPVYGLEGHYRALCAELADSVELLLAMRTALHQGQREFKQLAITEGRLDRARVALAEPVSPPEGEVAELMAWLRENAEDERQMCESSNRASLNLERVAELLQQQEAEIKRLRAQQTSVPVEGELPAAWLYLGEPDFDGTKWRENWRVTTDEQLALFKAQPDKPVPLFRRPAHALPVPQGVE